jgi:hypothetical protein
MKSVLRFVVGLTLLVLIDQAMLFSQNGTWTVIRTSGARSEPCLLDSLAGTILWFHTIDSTVYGISLDSLDSLIHHTPSHPVRGILIGACVGGAIGYLVDPEIFARTTSISWPWGTTTSAKIVPERGNVALSCSIAGGVLGYAIGQMTGGDTNYPPSEMSPKVKIGCVWSILQRDL